MKKTERDRKDERLLGKFELQTTVLKEESS